MKTNIVVTDVVNDVAYSRKNVNTRVVIILFITSRHIINDVIHLNQRRHMINGLKPI